MRAWSKTKGPVHSGSPNAEPGPKFKMDPIEDAFLRCCIDGKAMASDEEFSSFKEYLLGGGLIDRDDVELLERAKVL